MSEPPYWNGERGMDDWTRGVVFGLAAATIAWLAVVVGLAVILAAASALR